MLLRCRTRTATSPAGCLWKPFTVKVSFQVVSNLDVINPRTVCFPMSPSNATPLKKKKSLFVLIVLFTCNDEFQVERVLAGSVAGDAGVDACVAAGHRFDDQRVHAVFSHQHLMGRIRADGLSVQLPDEVRSGQAAHLQEGKNTEDITFE